MMQPSSTRTGTRPKGLSFRNSGWRCWPDCMSTVTISQSMSFSARTMRTFIPYGQSGWSYSVIRILVVYAATRRRPSGDRRTKALRVQFSCAFAHLSTSFNALTVENATDGRKGPSVDLAGPQALERLEVGRRAVAHVLAEAVAGEAGVHLQHQGIAVHFRVDGSRGDRVDERVGAHERGLAHLDVGDAARIDQQVVRPGLEPPHGPAHGFQAGIVHAQRVELRDLDDAEREPGRRATNLRRERLAPRRRQLLRVVDAGDEPRARGKHHRRRDHGPGPRAQPDLVDPRDASVAEVPEQRLEA